MEVMGLLVEVEEASAVVQLPVSRASLSEQLGEAMVDQEVPAEDLEVDSVVSMVAPTVDMEVPVEAMVDPATGVVEALAVENRCTWKWS